MIKANNTEGIAFKGSMLIFSQSFNTMHACTPKRIRKHVTIVSVQCMHTLLIN